ncbi:MAG: ankyrin repeat domain-containing protein [Pseudomonadota bacterium]
MSLLVSKIDKKWKMPIETVNEKDLFVAARYGNLVTLNAYLSTGGRLDFQDPDTLMTPIHIAAKNGQIEFINIAIKAESFFVNTEDRHHRTAFDVARDYGYRDIMKMLYDYAWDDADPIMSYARLKRIIPRNCKPNP